MLTFTVEMRRKIVYGFVIRIINYNFGTILPTYEHVGHVTHLMYILRFKFDYRIQENMVEFFTKSHKYQLWDSYGTVVTQKIDIIKTVNF